MKGENNGGMLSFLQITEENLRSGKYAGKTVVSPSFLLGPEAMEDLIIRGNDFHAVWDEDKGLWSTNEYDVIRMVDNAIADYCCKFSDQTRVVPKFMRLSSSGSIDTWHKYVKQQARDNHELINMDSKIIFADGVTKKTDYATKKLPYSMARGNIEAYDEIMRTLYDPDERDKLEWAIGAIISGDSKKLQKFIVLYGEPGAGKGTFLQIVEELFEGYTGTFNAKMLASSGSSFPLESLKTNPLIAIQHDGDLSKIDDNTLLNSIVSHENVVVNVKNKSIYSMKFNSFLFMGTNKPVKITDSKSGLNRRLIDVNPSGRKIPPDRYHDLMARVKFEYGAIAEHCLSKYKSMTFRYYDTYIPLSMIALTNDFYDFMDTNYYTFLETDYVTLREVWDLYKSYCEFASVSYLLPYRLVQVELGNYFNEVLDEYRDPETRKHYRKVYKGFRADKFKNAFTGNNVEPEQKTFETWINFNKGMSVFDIFCGDCPAQEATKDEKPKQKWADVETKLYQVNTKKVHYVKVPTNHIVIDFDLKDENGNKSFEKNLEAASKWPPTYAELSKSEAGIHLHYIYDGDPTKLSRVYDDEIEVKVFTGKSSLRRKLTRCNDLSIATINSGLPLKEEGNMVEFKTLKNERALRTVIKKNLNKEYHAATKPSVDFIYAVLEDAYKSGMQYDVSDMKQAVLYFASSSTHQAETCLELVSKMHFRSEEEVEGPEFEGEPPIVFYDVEVFPNLFLVNYKIAGNEEVVRLINPSPLEIEKLVNYRLVGFNCRRYDNHILYARMMGYDNEQLYKLSSRLVNKVKSVSQAAMFSNAYNLSYADIYDFMSTKQSLKKWEIELGIHHQELGMDWNEPVPEERWEEVAEYCDNDVIATETLFYSPGCQADFAARCILAELSGLPINSTTNSHSIKFIFGDNKKPQSQFNYPDLSKEFPGYKFDFVEKVTEANGKKIKTVKKQSSYMDVDDVGEGGYVYAEPGMYENVWTFDIASMHPHSIKAMNLFGDKYTKRFYDLVEIRIAIKHKEFDKVREMFDGKLAKYLNDESVAKNLAQALKIVINSVYGLTSAAFDNAFKDPRNVDNVVAKRGALFMITLRNKLQAMGVQVVHVKTDSIKIPNPSEEVKNYIYEFGKKYGYTFEVEDIYKKFCLVNDAVYIAQHEDGTWTATGAQFQQPYVFKTLFSKEPIIFEDMCETKQVQTSISLDMNEGKDDHDYQFVGRVGLFCPIKDGYGAGELVREQDDPKTGGKKFVSVTGTKGYRWLESEVVREKHLEGAIDKSYYAAMVDDAVATIEKFGDFEAFAA